MKATNPRKAWQAPKGPCIHCGQLEHRRSCVAELKAQLAELTRQIAELRSAIPVEAAVAETAEATGAAATELAALQQLAEAPVPG